MKKKIFEFVKDFISLLLSMAILFIIFRHITTFGSVMTIVAYFAGFSSTALSVIFLINDIRMWKERSE